MEDDFENWMRFKTVGGKLRRKPGIVPHKFECQTTRSAPPSKRTHTEDRHHQVQRQEALRNALVECNDVEMVDVNLQGFSQSIMGLIIYFKII